MRFIIFILLLMLNLNISANSQFLQVMTYNIRYDTEKDGVNAWSKRKDKVSALIKKYNPDILGVQEALRNQLEYLSNSLDGYVYVGVGRDDGKEQGEYSAILFKKERFKINTKGTIWLSETPDVPGSKSWDAAITRVATWMKVLDRRLNREFLIVNTHFDHIGVEARKNSAKLIREKITEMRSGLPVILTGDFNFTRDQEPYKVLTDKGDTMLLDPAPSAPSGTFCSFEVNSIKCSPIDYIFHTPELKANKYKVITDNDGKYYPSDHLPVLVELGFN
jgi:endonuclease/exonuclease/phosphatase family metal-dependent hydrolase